MSTGSSNSGTAAARDARIQQTLTPADLARQAAEVPGKTDNRKRGGRVPKRAKRGDTQKSVSALHREDIAEKRRKYGVIVAVLVACCAVSVFVDSGYGRLFDPVEVFTCYGIAIQQAIAGLPGGGDAASPNMILVDHPGYFRIVNRVSVTLMTVACGGVLAVAGALYQSAFKNPIASPSMLGVSSAIQLGDVILVLLFNTAAASHIGMRYLVCYLCVVVVTTMLFALGQLMTGRHRPLNVVNLLLIATVLNQLIGVIITYVTTYLFTEELWEVYNSMSEALSVNVDAVSWMTLAVTSVVGLAPVIALRFRLNGLNFEDADMRMLGIDAPRLRLIALLCGTVLLMAAQVQMGTIAMLALVVPHMSRMVFGSEFRKQLAGTVLMGAALLMFCRDVVGFIPYVGNLIPVSVVLNFVVMPFFVWMIAKQQKGWSE